MLVDENNMDVVKEVKQQLSSKFDKTDLGQEHFIIGMDIKRDREKKRIWLSEQ